MLSDELNYEFDITSSSSWIRFHSTTRSFILIHFYSNEFVSFNSSRETSIATSTAGDRCQRDSLSTGRSRRTFPYKQINHFFFFFNLLHQTMTEHFLLHFFSVRVSFGQAARDEAALKTASETTKLLVMLRQEKLFFWYSQNVVWRHFWVDSLHLSPWHFMPGGDKFFIIADGEAKAFVQGAEDGNQTDDATTMMCFFFFFFSHPNKDHLDVTLDVNKQVNQTYIYIYIYPCKECCWVAFMLWSEGLRSFFNPVGERFFFFRVLVWRIITHEPLF